MEAKDGDVKMVVTVHTIDEQRYRIHNDPPLKVDPPAPREHQETESHYQRVLDQTPSAPNPVADDTNDNLTNCDTDDAQVHHAVHEVRVTVRGVAPPALRVRRSKQGFKVPN